MKFYTTLEKEEKKWRREGFGGGGIKKDMEVTADVTKNIEHTQLPAVGREAGV